MTKQINKTISVGCYCLTNTNAVYQKTQHSLNNKIVLVSKINSDNEIVCKVNFEDEKSHVFLPFDVSELIILDEPDTLKQKLKVVDAVMDLQTENIFDNLTFSRKIPLIISFGFSESHDWKFKFSSWLLKFENKKLTVDDIDNFVNTNPKVNKKETFRKWFHYHISYIGKELIKVD